MNSRNSNQMTPWQVFGVALAIVTFVVLAIIWSDLTTKWSHDHLEYMGFATSKGRIINHKNHFNCWFFNG